MQALWKLCGFAMFTGQARKVMLWLAVLFTAPTYAAPLIYSEATDGDLQCPPYAGTAFSGQYCIGQDALTTLSLGFGANLIQGTSSLVPGIDSDWDGFWFTLPSGSRLTKVVAYFDAPEFAVWTWDLSIGQTTIHSTPPCGVVTCGVLPQMTPTEIFDEDMISGWMFRNPGLTSPVFSLAPSQMCCSNFLPGSGLNPPPSAYPVYGDWSFTVFVEIPEPATIALVSAALLGIAVTRRRSAPVLMARRDPPDLVQKPNTV